ncbi:MAG: hypothetical protein JXR14_05970 [Paracoccaceae bacterium]
MGSLGADPVIWQLFSGLRDGEETLFVLTREGGFAAFDLAQGQLAAAASLPSNTWIPLGFGSGTQALSADTLAGLLRDADQGFSDGVSARAAQYQGAPVLGATPELLVTGSGSATFLVAQDPGDRALTVFALPDGAPDATRVIQSDPALASYEATQISAISGASGGFVFSVEANTDRVHSWSLSETGQFTLLDTLDPLYGLAGATDLATAVVNGQTYVLASGGTSGSLSVLEVNSAGGLRATDHILDRGNYALASAQFAEPFRVGEQSFVLTGGGEAGLSLFALLPDGRLVHRLTLADTAQTSLDRISTLELTEVEGDLQLFVAADREGGLSQFRIETGDVGLSRIGSGADETLSGSARDDVIMGGGGHDTLSGGSGDDILVDGAGADLLIGGAGGDLFIFKPDGAEDTIADFTPGLDRIDLSEFRFLRSPGDLTITQTATGARLALGEEDLVLMSFDGQPIDPNSFSLEDLFNADRPFSSFLVTEGDDGNDQLTGTSGDDRIYAMAGDDTLIGTAGTDILDGGEGTDLVDFSATLQPVSVDLAAGSGAMAAAGDTYIDIEDVTGTAFDDVIAGDAGANGLNGGAGADTLSGAGGNDTLLGGTASDLIYGGGGDDWIEGNDTSDTLWGGEGQDTIYGQSGRDTAYGEAGDDVMFGGAGIDTFYGGDGADTIVGNTASDWIYGGTGDDVLSGSAGRDTLFGEAGNDTLRGGSAADTLYGGADQDTLFGSAGSDFLYGDAGQDVLLAGTGADLLDGGAGDDRLEGQAGDDTLIGGTGNDTLLAASGIDSLDGGSGDDILSGGKGEDRFIFAEGHDTITDFNLLYDEILLSSALVSGTPSTAEIIAEYGQIVGDDLRLDFGADSLLIEGLSDPFAFTDQISILG